jgi:hypothetical protein
MTPSDFLWSICGMLVFRMVETISTLIYLSRNSKMLILCY